jgi:ComF family protein
MRTWGFDPGNGGACPVLKAFLDIIFPPRCHSCKEFIPDAGGLHLCAACMDAASMIVSPLCRICGAPFATEGGSDHLCGGCLTSAPPFASARAAALFDGPVREMVHRFKYDRRVQLSRPLGLLTSHHLGEFAALASVELVIPVPLHVKRLRQRGFNQAVLIGEILAREWRVPISRGNLRRIRWTEPQVTLAAGERAANVRGAFAVSAPLTLQGKRIILVDDVYTTGSTVAECAGVLRKAGASAVFVVTVARARQ